MNMRRMLQTGAYFERQDFDSEEKELELGKRGISELLHT